MMMLEHFCKTVSVYADSLRRKLMLKRAEKSVVATTELLNASQEVVSVYGSDGIVTIDVIKFGSEGELVTVDDTIVSLGHFGEISSSDSRRIILNMNAKTYVDMRQHSLTNDEVVSYIGSR